MDESMNKTSESAVKSESQPDFKLLDEIIQIREEVSYLKDLFVRRLSDDKQKNSAIQKLAEGASYAFIEPFLYDIILLLDRLEKSDDDFVMSVKEELYDIINRRGVEKISVEKEFDPAFCKAIRVVESLDTEALYVSEIVRNGYALNGKIIRPVEVVLTKPASEKK